MDVSLSPELEDLIRWRLETGMYKNAAEVVCEGLRLLTEEDAWKADVRRKIQEGVTQLSAGQVVDGEKAVDEIVQDLRGRRDRTPGA